MVEAICKELMLRKNEITEPLESIYFGGGTPSLLSIDEIALILSTLKENYNILPGSEITLEANPDDLTKEKTSQLKALSINRLSIGIQSFFDEDLQWMNRTHTAQSAEQAIKNALHNGFDNLTIDLIYGVPGLTNERWKENLDKAYQYGITHVSSYCLTVEENTALSHFIKKGKYVQPDEDQSLQQFDILCEFARNNGFEQYEISNFARNKKYAVHNTNYWKGKSYLGIGPSAHSFHNGIRSWNIANNTKYIQSITNNILPSEKEILTDENRFNEYIMTGLRTMWGCDLIWLKENFPTVIEAQQKLIDEKILSGLLMVNNNHLIITEKGKFLADGIASDLFV